MIFKDFLVTEDDEQRRLDKVLSCIFPKKHEPFAKLLRKKLIKVNDKKAEPSIRLSRGDKISIASFLLTPDEYKSTSDSQDESSIDIETIFENEHLKVINKPYGINVQPSKDSDIDLSSLMQKKDSITPSLSFKTGALHRLDKNTTGILVFSRSLKGARWFSKNIQDHTIRKTYIGIVSGRLNDKALWKDNLQSNISDTGFHTVRVSAVGQEAVTQAAPLCYGIYKGREVTLVQFDIPTGRKHQIRCQSSFHGYPLLGDKAYGSQLTDRKQEFYLHAIRMTFPKDNEAGLPSEIKAPLPQAFSQMLRECLINWNSELII